MAGAAPITSGKGGKKAVDAPINLVPFIDLLSCCICFLLITAVWVNLAAMETNQRAPSKKAISEEPMGDVTQLVLYIDKNRYLFKVRKNGKDNIAVNIPLINGQLNRKKLQEVLESLREAGLKQNDLIFLVADSVSWEWVIQSMEIAASFKKEDGSDYFSVQLSDQTIFDKAQAADSNRGATQNAGGNP